jgi:hypothetical protein
MNKAGKVRSFPYLLLAELLLDKVGRIDPDVPSPATDCRDADLKKLKE